MASIDWEKGTFDKEESPRTAAALMGYEDVLRTWAHEEFWHLGWNPDVDITAVGRRYRPNIPGVGNYYAKWRELDYVVEVSLRTGPRGGRTVLARKRVAVASQSVASLNRVLFYKGRAVQDLVIKRDLRQQLARKGIFPDGINPADYCPRCSAQKPVPA